EGGGAEGDRRVAAEEGEGPLEEGGGGGSVAEVEVERCEVDEGVADLGVVRAEVPLTGGQGASEHPPRAVEFAAAEAHDTLRVEEVDPDGVVLRQQPSERLGGSGVGRGGLHEAAGVAERVALVPQAPGVGEAGGEPRR